MPLLFLFRGLNVSVFLVSGGLLVCLSYLAELGVAASHCLPTLGVFVSKVGQQLQKRDYCYIGCVLFSFIDVLNTVLCLFFLPFVRVYDLASVSVKGQ